MKELNQSSPVYESMLIEIYYDQNYIKYILLVICIESHHKV